VREREREREREISLLASRIGADGECVEMRERERENRDMSLLASKLAAEDQYDYVCERKGGRE